VTTVQRCLLTSIVLAVLPCTAVAQELLSPSFRIPAHTLNSGCVSEPDLGSPSFQGGGCLGELGAMVHTSSSFRMLAGYCAQEHWLKTGTTVDVPDGPPSVAATFMSSPMPNPATGTASIDLAIRQGDVASLRLYDVSGRVVRTWFTGMRGPVRQTFVLDRKGDNGSPLEAGLYFVRMHSNARTTSHKLVLLGN